MTLRSRKEVEREGRGSPERGAVEEDPGAPTRSRRRQLPGWARAGAVALGCILVLWLARVPLLTGIGRLLVVRDEPAAADLIYQFGGDWIARARVAAELYHQGLAPRVVLMEVERIPEEIGLTPGETEVTVRLLQSLRVPRSAIVVYRSGEGVASTMEEAEALAAVLRGSDARRVIAVTSWFHTRRARWALRRALDQTPLEVMMVGAPTPGFSPNNWWRAEKGLIRVFEEYLKFAHNWVYR
ncbi:MAG: YdcF family protein [Gemmatimonadetes bacterium]|nr:YdcF family protein [Gemmatimonadota bacterium]